MILRLFKIVIAVMFLSTVLYGCTDEQVGNSPPPAKSNKVVPAPAAKRVVEVKPEDAKVEVAFVYDPSGQRDPFEALLSVRKPITQEGVVPLTPLQKYDLGQFRLIGAIIGKGDPKAMVEAPGGKPFMIQKGVKIGKNNGVVIDITESEVLVEERYYDFSGAVRTSQNSIQFPPREGVN
jgi:type IV pilus assembly protein PilP